MKQYRGQEHCKNNATNGQYFKHDVMKGTSRTHKQKKEVFSLALNFLSHCVYLLWPYSIILHYHALNCTLRLCFNSVGKYNFNFGLSRHERHNISDQTNQLQSVALTSCRGLSKFLLLILLLSYFYYYCYYYCFYYYCCYYDYHLVQLYISCRTCLHHMTSQISV